MITTTSDRATARRARCRRGGVAGALLPVAAGLALALSGCDGGASADPAGTPTVDPAAQALKFTRCMREQGVDMPDPEPGGGIRIRARKGEEGKVEAAQKACKRFDPMADGANRPGPEDLDRQLTLARCLREHGVDVSDPKAGEPMRIRGRADSESATRAAMRACEKQVPPLGPTPGR